MRGLSRHKIAVIGLGYVGLPLAVEFGKKYRTVGFDTSRPHQLRAGRDVTLTTVRNSTRPLRSRRSPGSQVLQRVHRHGADAIDRTSGRTWRRCCG